MKPEEIVLDKTCCICPEQYDAIYDDATIAYLRLRHGHFTVQCPDVGGRLVYSANVDGDGCFDNEHEREFHLQ
ncbi:MAG: hypothetical protein Q4P20_13375, partial [Eubacteriales bacterium]|nr:hypothetical protein [Eubacteriales bacterium]